MPTDRPGASRTRRLSSELLSRVWGSLAKEGRRGVSPSAGLATSLAHALLSERGEVSGARLAADLRAAYDGLDQSSREQFLNSLVHEFAPDAQELDAAIADHRANPSPATLVRLQRATEPPRQELFRRFNMAPSGTASLVAMRREVLRLLDDHAEWCVLDEDLLHLLRSWFNPGFLELRRIDWRTPAVTLERLIQYEAVHAIQGWRDLRRRLESDRRCYGFFHRALPDEPIIFIEVALTREMPAQVEALLDPSAPVEPSERATHAIFYSITSCQEGLRGLSFGNFLIKQVVEDLGREFPRIRTFATLSPIPGFLRWLAGGTEQSPKQRRPALVDAFTAALATDVAAASALLTEQLRPQLMALCAHYLVHEKKAQQALDPVARFHLANGARLERLNWKGDLSETGLLQSLGMTANYLYRIADVERNHEAYATQSRVITSASVARLAKPGKPSFGGRARP